MQLLCVLEADGQLLPEDRTAAKWFRLSDGVRITYWLSKQLYGRVELTPATLG